MSPSTIDFLYHILDELDFLLAKSANLQQEDFMQDRILQHAFTRSLEIIGEATKQLPPSLRQRHSDMPWRELAGLRDVLIHRYFGVDYDIVWEVISQKAPGLRRQINHVIERESRGHSTDKWSKAPTKPPKTYSSRPTGCCAT